MHFTSLPQWRALRLEALRRDKYRCVVCGRGIWGKGANRVDHIKPRSTHPELTFVLSNLRSLCPLHDNQSHREKGLGCVERVERFTIKGCDAQGWPLVPAQQQHGKWAGSEGLLARPPGLRPAVIPTVIVTGAPGAGKNYYVEHHQGEGDLVIDLDQIGRRLQDAGYVGPDGGATLPPMPTPMHQWDRGRWLVPALTERNRLLRAIAERPCKWPRAWFIICEPRPEHRAWWARMLKPDRVVVITTPMAECIKRADDEQRMKAIERYFDVFTPGVCDEVVSGIQPIRV